MVHQLLQRAVDKVGLSEAIAIVGAVHEAVLQLAVTPEGFQASA